MNTIRRVHIIAIPEILRWSCALCEEEYGPGAKYLQKLEMVVTLCMVLGKYSLSRCCDVSMLLLCE